ncbi:hypothetical protein D0T84_16285 [Dysgonomonas sp. 521]|uniref:hypothetical protein n=1 Tax=Dysgonomonas sp. 521 TaxID=2302932 RepID=UPI0013D400EC|nr:hypothetical protein [Dysgonomonas sp. 521]NDV96460.1 hypothetical protein [Dysgonomonas sp. 521]
MKATGYIWLCDARQKLGKVLNKMKSGTPIRYSMEESGNEQQYILSGNGVIITICIQILKPIHKGGVQ